MGPRFPHGLTGVLAVQFLVDDGRLDERESLLVIGCTLTARKRVGHASIARSKEPPHPPPCCRDRYDLGLRSPSLRPGDRLASATVAAAASTASSYFARRHHQSGGSERSPARCASRAADQPPIARLCQVGVVQDKHHEWPTCLPVPDAPTGGGRALTSSPCVPRVWGCCQPEPILAAWQGTGRHRVGWEGTTMMPGWELVVVGDELLSIAGDDVCRVWAPAPGWVTVCLPCWGLVPLGLGFCVESSRACHWWSRHPLPGPACMVGFVKCPGWWRAPRSGVPGRRTRRVLVYKERFVHGALPHGDWKGQHPVKGSLSSGDGDCAKSSCDLSSPVN